VAVVTARPTDIPTYSLLGHVAAVTSLGFLVVLTAANLVWTRHRLMAAVVLAATAAGPMTVIAVPVTRSLVAGSSMDTVWWWHVIVAATVLLVLVGWTSFVVKANSGNFADAPPVASRAFLDVAFASAVLVALAVCWNHAWQLGRVS
jgi:hypothetical protein